jgi:hypothetical protein
MWSTSSTAADACNDFEKPRFGRGFFCVAVGRNRDHNFRISIWGTFMAEGKLLNIANAGGAVAGALVGGLGVMFALGDTSPKSLEGMASSLERIAENLDKMDPIDAASAAEAANLLTRAGEISRKVVEKAPGVELPNVDGILLTDEGVDVPSGETKTVLLANGERVSTSYVTRSGSRFGLSVNGVQHAYYIGDRVYQSEDGACFIELLRSTQNYASVVVRPVCP